MQATALPAPVVPRRREPSAALALPAPGGTPSQVPSVVVWQLTRACEARCRCCPLGAAPRRSPHELTAGEALEVIADLQRLGVPRLVLTGGDPLRRPDLVELVAAAASAGLRVELATAATALASAALLRRLGDAGLASLALGLDGSRAAIHDGFRGVSGSFRQARRVLRAARRCGLERRICTTVGRHNVEDLEALAALLTALGVSLWSVSFLLPSADEQPEEIADAQELEELLRRLYDLSCSLPFEVVTRAAPQYRRVVLQREAGEGAAGPSRPPAGRDRRSGRRSGDRETLFISYQGEIFPSRRLPLSAGNVLTHELADVYRTSPLLRALRDPERLKGKCGVCEYRQVCGGSRARASALTGDPLEAEPFCAYVPARYAQSVAAGEAEEVQDYFARRIRGWPRAPSGPLRAESLTLWEFVNRSRAAAAPATTV